MTPTSSPRSLPSQIIVPLPPWTRRDWMPCARSMDLQSRQGLHHPAKKETANQAWSSRQYPGSPQYDSPLRQRLHPLTLLDTLFQNLQHLRNCRRHLTLPMLSHPSAPLRPCHLVQVLSWRPRTQVTPLASGKVDLDLKESLHLQTATRPDKSQRTKNPTTGILQRRKRYWTSKSTESRGQVRRTHQPRLMFRPWKMPSPAKPISQAEHGSSSHSRIKISSSRHLFSHTST